MVVRRLARFPLTPSRRTRARAAAGCTADCARAVRTQRVDLGGARGAAPGAAGCGCGTGGGGPAARTGRGPAGAARLGPQAAAPRGYRTRAAADRRT